MTEATTTPTTPTATTATGIAAQLARANILELQPYRCARDDYSSGIALLDANENAYGSPIQQQEDDTTNGAGGGTTVERMEYHRYPDPHQTALKQAVVAFRQPYQVTVDNIFAGVGSDEAIDLLIRIFCVPGTDCIMTTPPTYGMYKVCAKINNVNVVTVPLTESFDLQVDQMIETAHSNTNIKLIFVCSPGNPTCKAIRKDDIRRLAMACAETALIVVDEAYIDFCLDDDVSALDLVGGSNGGASLLPNVCVLQTLSKAFGMAAVRCGFLFAAPDVITLMNNVKAPYNINGLTSRAALAALAQSAAVRRNVELLLEQRGQVMTALTQRSYVEHVYSSDANFILFRLTAQYNAEHIYKCMADRGIVTRYRGNELHCHNCIRVTVGTANENRAFLAMLDDVVSSMTSTTTTTTTTSAEE